LYVCSIAQHWSSGEADLEAINTGRGRTAAADPREFTKDAQMRKIMQAANSIATMAWEVAAMGLTPRQRRWVKREAKARQYAANGLNGPRAVCRRAMQIMDGRLQVTP
jgi:hypothetical protein